MQKIVCLLLLAFAATEIAGTPVENAPERVENITNDIKELLEKLTKVVTKAVDDGIKQLKKIEDGVIEFINGLIDGSGDRVAAAMKKLLDELNEIEKKEIDADVDITDCLVDKADELMNIPVKTAAGITKCADNAIADVQNVVNGAIKSINEVAKIVDTLEKKVEACGTGILSLPCLGRVAAEISLDIVQVPVKITVHVAKAVQTAVLIKPKAESCVVLQIASVPIKGGILIADIAKCAQDKEKQ